MPVRVVNRPCVAVRIVAAVSLATALSALPSHHAAAAPKVSIKTVHYSVRGNTPQTMLAYMLRNGPHGAAGRALGTTSATISQNMNLEPVGNGCLIRNYKLTVAITMNVPKLAAGQQLSASVRSRWNGMAAYIRTHENHHKNVFLACARKIDQRVRAVSRTRSCAAIRSRVRAIFNEENAKCDRIHSAYDQGEAARVRNMPFIRQAAAPEAPRQTRTQQHRTTRQSSRAPVANQDLK
jgi:predicted secreted Zn-dependent protease